jgi:hypothetical protein
MAPVAAPLSALGARTSGSTGEWSKPKARSPRQEPPRVGAKNASDDGSSGSDRLTSVATYSVLVTPTTLQQLTGFRTVIVNAGTGADTATLDDTLNASGGLAELIYSSGRKVQLNGFDTVTARGTNGGVNRRNVTGTLAYVLRFTGTWV